MYYGSGTADRIATGKPAETAGDGQTLHVHSSDGSTFLHKVLKAWHHIKKPDSVNRCVFTWRI